MNCRVGCDNRDTSVNNLFYIRCGSRIVVNLYDNQIVLFGYAVLKKAVYLVVVSLTTEVLKGDVIILFRSRLHLTGQPCSEGISTCTCDESYTIVIAAFSVAAFSISAAATSGQGEYHSQNEH